MITLQDLCEHLNTLMQVGLFQDACINGLQVEGAANIRKICVAVSASRHTIEMAIDKGADALITHHGLFWNRDPYALVGARRKKVALLLEHNLSLLSYHLPLDAHKELGNNWKAAADLGWNNLQPFGLYNGQMIGVRGEFPSMPVEVFQQILEEYYNHKAHTALFGKPFVSSACLISGGAYKSIDEAAKAGADCFITGNFDEPAWHMAQEEDMNFFALGHSATEVVGPKALGAYLEKQLGVEVFFLDLFNPF